MFLCLVAPGITTASGYHSVLKDSLSKSRRESLSIEVGLNVRNFNL